MVDFFNSLKAPELVALIGITLTLFVGGLNIVISSHKNRLEGITQNRMQWINAVRELTGRITAWRFVLKNDTGSLKNLRQDVNMLILYLNVGRKIDNEIIEAALKMYDTAYEISFYENLQSQKSQELYEKFYYHRQGVRTLMRIYLKKEWTRVKAESSVWRVPFRNYWIPFLGFSENWATKSLTKKYKKISTYDFKPWTIIELNANMVWDERLAIVIEQDKECQKLKVPYEIRNEYDPFIKVSDEKLGVPDGKIKVPDVRLG